MRESAIEQAIRRLAKPGTFLHGLITSCIPGKFRGTMNKHLVLSMELARRRLEANDSHKDLMSHIVRQKEVKGEITVDDILVSSAVLMLAPSCYPVCWITYIDISNRFAGSQTTACLLSALTYYILSDKSAYDRLTTEIRSAFHTEEEINPKSLATLQFLNACIEESLRMFPPVPIGLPRIVPKDGAVIDGNWVPAGVSSNINLLVSK